MDGLCWKSSALGTFLSFLNTRPWKMSRCRSFSNPVRPLILDFRSGIEEFLATCIWKSDPLRVLTLIVMQVEIVEVEVDEVIGTREMVRYSTERKRVCENITKSIQGIRWKAHMNVQIVAFTLFRFTVKRLQQITRRKEKYAENIPSFCPNSHTQKAKRVGISI